MQNENLAALTEDGTITPPPIPEELWMLFAYGPQPRVFWMDPELASKPEQGKLVYFSEEEAKANIEWYEKTRNTKVKAVRVK